MIRFLIGIFMTKIAIVNFCVLQLYDILMYKNKYETLQKFNTCFYWFTNK